MGFSRIRAARVEEGNGLTQLCVRATIPYGYDDQAIQRFQPALNVSPALIAAGLAFVAEDENGAAIGVMAVRPTQFGGLALLDRVFVDPSAQRKGVGRKLFAAAVDVAATLSGSVMLIYAHPLAAGFYERLGAAQVGETPFHLAPELRMPMMIYSIPSAEAASKAGGP